MKEERLTIDRAEVMRLVYGFVFLIIMLNIYMAILWHNWMALAWVIGSHMMQFAHEYHNQNAFMGNTILLSVVLKNGYSASSI